MKFDIGNEQWVGLDELSPEEQKKLLGALFGPLEPEELKNLYNKVVRRRNK